MHKLTIEDDEGKTVVVPLIRDEITVGRQEGNSIRLTERNISRRHARFYRQGGTLFVEDTGSFNGVKVNGGKLVGPSPLKDGDLVIIGDYKLTVRADRPVATRLYGTGVPFTTPPGTAPGPVAPPAATAPLPAGALGVQTRAQPPSSAAPSPALSPSVSPPPVAPLSPPGTAPPPVAALDAAPTIPVRTLAEQSLVPGQAPGPSPARLVVVTTNLAGSEFVLDRPSLVIGRTAENDIVLNHKSISRHHAKVIRDGDKYIVVDLESANGVRVNGGEFERVELKSGDTLELGHVRLRFTSGADYVDFDIGEASRSRRRLLFAGAGGAVVLAGFAIAFALRSGGEVASNDAVKPAVVPSQVGAGSPDPTPAPMPPVATTPSGSSVAPEALLAQAKADKAKESWDSALENVKAALELAPLSQEALTLREAIESEQEASTRFSRIKEAAKASNYDEVLNLFGGIAESSIYRTRALSLRRIAQTKVIAHRLAEAQKFAAQGQCDEARAESERVLALDSENDGARQAIERCERVAARIVEQRQRQEREVAAKEAAAKEAQAKEEAARQAKADKEAKELAAREAKEARAREARERETEAKALKDAQAKEAREREAAARVAREAEAKAAKETREAQAKEAREKEAQAKALKDAEAKEAREREAIARAAKEAEAKEVREKEAAARAVREAQAKEEKEREAVARAAKEAQAKEAKERAAKEAQEREAIARAAKEAQAKEAKERAAKEAQAKALKDAQAKEAREREAAAARAVKEAQAKEAREREAAAARATKEAQAKEAKEREAARVAAAREAASRTVARAPVEARPSPPTPRPSEPRPAPPSRATSSAAQRALALVPQTTPPPQRAPAPPAPPEPAGDPEALLRDATTAWLRGQYMLAIDNSRRALRIKPGLTEAYKIIATCSCSLRDADEATKAYARVDDKVKAMIKTLCLKSGIQLN